MQKGSVKEDSTIFGCGVSVTAAEAQKREENEQIVGARVFFVEVAIIKKRVCVTSGYQSEHT